MRKPEYSMKKFFQNLYRMQGQQFVFRAESEEAFASWKEAFRDALWARLGLGLLEKLGASVQGRQVNLLEETQQDGYRCRKYVMETLPEVYMPFYMLLPERIQDAGEIAGGMDASQTARGMGGGILAGQPDSCAFSCARAILAIPAHGANKNTVCGIAGTEAEAEKIKAAPAECYGAAFARKGYVVFCPDPPGYGERVEPKPAEDICFLGPQERSSLDSSCKDLAQTAEALDISLTALEIWELRRLLDFACSCPEVTADGQGKRIGCAGFSGGGQYSMWLAALDDRVRLAVVSGYVHGYLDSLLNCHLCPCNYVPGLWTLGDISDICALIAPRPLFVENGTEDVENGPDGIEGPKRQVEKTRKAYKLLGQEDSLQHSTPEGPHKWYGACYDFVEKML